MKFKYIECKKDVYSVSIILMVLLIAVQTFFENTRETINILIFNPYWGMVRSCEIVSQSNKDEVWQMRRY